MYILVLTMYQVQKYTHQHIFVISFRDILHSPAPDSKTDSDHDLNPSVNLKNQV